MIAALVSKSFSRAEFLKSLDKFYKAIELAADTSDKQHFLDAVYERFFQGYSVKVADTQGIVYTPQPIVDFMCASVEEVLKVALRSRARNCAKMSYSFFPSCFTLAVPVGWTSQGGCFGS